MTKSLSNLYIENLAKKEKRKQAPQYVSPSIEPLPRIHESHGSSSIPKYQEIPAMLPPLANAVSMSASDTLSMSNKPFFSPSITVVRQEAIPLHSAYECTNTLAASTQALKDTYTRVMHVLTTNDYSNIIPSHQSVDKGYILATLDMMCHDALQTHYTCLEKDLPDYHAHDIRRRYTNQLPTLSDMLATPSTHSLAEQYNAYTPWRQGTNSLVDRALQASHPIAVSSVISGCCTSLPSLSSDSPEPELEDLFLKIAQVEIPEIFHTLQLTDPLVKVIYPYRPSKHISGQDVSQSMDSRSSLRISSSQLLLSSMNSSLDLPNVTKLKTNASVPMKRLKSHVQIDARTVDDTYYDFVYVDTLLGYFYHWM